MNALKVLLVFLYADKSASKCEIVVSVHTIGELNEMWHKYLVTGHRVVYISQIPNIKSKNIGTAQTCGVRATTSPINPYPTAFPYGNGMVLHFYQQQESSTTKTVHKVINKGLKTYV